MGFATANPFALQEIWGCTNRGSMWSRDAGHQYNTFKSNRNSCREIVCINLCPSKSSLCAMLRLLLTKSLIIDETGCAMVILLPWCDFPLPDVTFCIAAVPWGWCDFSRMMWLKHGARSGIAGAFRSVEVAHRPWCIGACCKPFLPLLGQRQVVLREGHVPWSVEQISRSQKDQKD